MGVVGSSPKVGRPAWPGFLRAEDPQGIHARLSEGDPLHLREGTARRLREVWVLLDPDRVFRRALAVCADAVPCEDPPEDLAAWARVKIDLAIEQLVRADREAQLARPDVLTEEEKDFPLLTQSLFLEPALVRSASVAFNALGPLPRRAFFELLIEARPVPEVVEAGPWDEDGLYDAIQTALAPFGLDVPPGSTDDPPAGKRKKEGKKKR
jgi:hypothetical protein